MRLFVLVGLTASSPYATVAGPGAPPQAATTGSQPSDLEVAKATVLAVELVDPVHSSKNKAGDTFRARVNEGIWVRGRVAIPPGTTIRGLVTEAIPSGRVKGRAKLSITLQSVEMEGHSYAIHTDTLSYLGEPHTGKHLGSWLAGAFQGALYGVLFGGKEGAVMGAGAGAAAGTASSILTGKLDIDFPQGSKLLFETMEPLRVPEPPAAPPQPTSPAKPDEKTKPSQELPKQPPTREARPTG